MSASISSMRSAFVIDEWASALSATRKRRPLPPGARCFAVSRATASADRLPADPPDTKQPPAESGNPARSAITRSTWFSACTAPAASSQEMPWIDAHETSMSNSSDALVGAAGMKPRKRGLSAAITAGASADVYTPSTWSGSWPSSDSSSRVTASSMAGSCTPPPSGAGSRSSRFCA
jgi:hypothetical protein